MDNICVRSLSKTLKRCGSEHTLAVKIQAIFHPK